MRYRVAFVRLVYPDDAERVLAAFELTIRCGGLYGRAGGLAEVVLRDAADVDRVLRRFHRARFDGSRLLVARATR